MKIQVTKKAIKENYENIIAIGYCNAQNMLKGQDAKMFSAGVYGWSCDYYAINNDTIISTGYSPIGQDIPSEIIKKYEAIAENINYSNYNNWDDYIIALNNNLDMFINEVL